MRKHFPKGLVLLSLLASAINARAAIKPLAPGQYELGGGGAPQVQQICLKGDGTWYGTTFNFGGRWIARSPGPTNNVAAIYGSYSVQGHRGKAFGKDTITIEHPAGTGLILLWYDWFADFSFANLLQGGPLFIKKDCDPPFTEMNTKAATQ